MTDPFARLPEELHTRIFQCLSVSALLTASLVSKRWYRLCGDDAVWLRLCRQRWRNKTHFDIRGDKHIEFALRSPHLTWKERYILAETDAQRTSITEQELVGYQWSFLFKETGDGQQGVVVFNPDHSLDLYAVGYDQRIEWALAPDGNSMQVAFYPLHTFDRDPETWQWIITNAFVVYRSYPKTLDLMTPLNELQRQLREEARPVQLPIAATPALPLPSDPLPNHGLSFPPDPSPSLHLCPDSLHGDFFSEEDFLYGDELEYDIDEDSEESEGSGSSDPGESKGSSPPEKPEFELRAEEVENGRVEGEEVEGVREKEGGYFSESPNRPRYNSRHPPFLDLLLPLPHTPSSSGRGSSANVGERRASSSSRPSSFNAVSVSNSSSNEGTHLPNIDTCSSNEAPNLSDPMITKESSRGQKRDREETYPQTGSFILSNNSQNGNPAERDTKRKRYDNSDGQDATRQS